MDRVEKFLQFARVFAERIPMLRGLALIHPAFGIFNLLVPTGENPSQRILDQLERGFEDVNNNLKRLELELKMEIERNRVFTAMSHINTGYYAVEQMQTSANPDSWKSNLKTTHGPTIEKDVNVVLDALSVFETLYIQSNGYRQKIIDLGAAISVNVVKGFIVFETCEDLKPENERRPVDERRSGILTKFQTVIDTVKRYTDMCEEKVSSNMEADIDRLLRENINKHERTTCEILGEFLKLKYDWLRISVIVYEIPEPCRGMVKGEFSFTRPRNSSTRGHFLKLEFAKKNTSVRYYKSDGRIGGIGRAENVLSGIRGVRTKSSDMLNLKLNTNMTTLIHHLCHVLKKIPKIVSYYF